MKPDWITFQVFSSSQSFFKLAMHIHTSPFLRLKKYTKIKKRANSPSVLNTLIIKVAIDKYIQLYIIHFDYICEMHYNNNSYITNSHHYTVLLFDQPWSLGGCSFLSILLNEHTLCSWTLCVAVYHCKLSLNFACISMHLPFFHWKRNMELPGSISILTKISYVSCDGGKTVSSEYSESNSTKIS